MKNIFLPAAFSLALMSTAAFSAHSGQKAENYPALKNLPVKAQAAWRRYFKRSDHWRNVDDTFIRAELKTLNQQQPVPPPHAQRFGFDPRQPVEWYATAEGGRVADIVLSFQTPSGGWSKRTDMATRPRRPGEAFGVESGYIPTFDNGATTTQLQVMARAYKATHDKKYREAFLKGVRLILAAQFPNGGWPQNFPLTGGYHDYITYNDETMINLLSLLRDVAERRPLYAFVPATLRRQAQAAVRRGLDCVLNTQIVVNGVKTVWAGQHDTFTLAPQSARAYEMVAQASRESSALLDFLMTLRAPSADIIDAVDSAAAWFEKVKIVGYRWNLELGVSSSLTAEPGAGPLWARFYEIGTDRPLFGDRNRSIHYDITEISHERQIKYAWYIEEPVRTLARYREWRKRYPAAGRNNH
jgi:PelA/Pel-15E family pectate lyase